LRDQHWTRALGSAIFVTGLLAGLTLFGAVGRPDTSSHRGSVVLAAGAPKASTPATPRPPPTSTGPGAGAGANPGAGPAHAAGQHVVTAVRPASTTTVAPSAAGPGSTRPPTPAPAAPTPAAPGTYHYHQTSSQPGTPPEGTLVVAPASASGTQVWTRNVGGNVRPSSTVMLFNSSGIFMLSPSGQVAGTAGACSFAAPLPWPPFPLAAGQSFAGHAACSGPVQTFVVSGQVGQVEPLPLNGAMVGTFKVTSNFVLQGSYSGSPLNVTVAETDWYAPSLPVPVQTRTHLVGRVLGLSVTSDTNYLLASSTPS